MKRAVILGYQFLDFQPEGKEAITGYKVWYAADGSERVIGQIAGVCWQTVIQWNKRPLAVGEVCAVTFNEKGKVEAFLPEEVLAYVA